MCLKSRRPVQSGLVSDVLDPGLPRELNPHLEEKETYHAPSDLRMQHRILGNSSPSPCLHLLHNFVWICGRACVGYFHCLMATQPWHFQESAITFIITDIEYERSLDGSSQLDRFVSDPGLEDMVNLKPGRPFMEAHELPAP